MLQTLPNHDLINETRKAVAEERKATMAVLNYLREIERRKLYRKQGHSSLFAMATKEFGYSEAAAQRRINAMRLVRDLPEAAMKIQKGELTLTSAASAHAFIKSMKLNFAARTELVNTLVNKSTREVEKELSARDPEKEKREDFRYTNGDRLRLSLNISEDLFAKLETLKYKKGFKTLEALLHHLTDKEIETTTPAKHVSHNATPAPECRSRYVSKITKKIVIKKNPNPSCEYQDTNGKRCEQKTDLQFDHKIPFSKGGPNITTNLRLLCGHHNRYLWNHEQKKE